MSKIFILNNLNSLLLTNFKKKVDQADPPFPRPVAHWWYGCSNVPSTFSQSGNVQVDPDRSDLNHNDNDVGDFGLGAGK